MSDGCPLEGNLYFYSEKMGAHQENRVFVTSFPDWEFRDHGNILQLCPDMNIQVCTFGIFGTQKPLKTI